MPDLTHEKPSQKPVSQSEVSAPAPKTPNLDAWLESVAARDPLQAISRFGFKTAHDVKVFLHSPVGKAVEASIERSIAETKSFENQQHLSMLQKTRFKHRAIAFLFASYFSKKSVAAKHYAEQIEKANKLAIEHAEPTHVPLYLPDHHEVIQYDTAEITTFYQNLRAISLEMEHEIEERLQDYLQQQILVEQKYEHFDLCITEMDAEENLLDAEQIATRIAALSAEMEEQVDAMQDLIANDRDEEAMLLRDKHNGLHLKVAYLKDVLAVIHQAKYYADENGKPVDALKKAAFVLSRGEHIVEHQGKRYLLDKEKTWDSIKDSQEAQQEAERKYTQLQPELMSVKRLVQHNKALETAFIQQRVATTKIQLTEQRAETTLIDNQRLLLQSARVTTQDTFERTDTQPVPRPTLTPGSTAKPRVNESAAAQVFKSELLKLKKQPLNASNLTAIMEKLPDSNAKMALGRCISTLPGNIDMQNLLKSMARFGQDPYKHAVTPIKSPLEEQRASTAPTPFSRKPKLPL